MAALDKPLSEAAPTALDEKLSAELEARLHLENVFEPPEECARRDPKGLYARALKGEIANFTGVDSPYEAPENADVHLETAGRAPEEMADELENWLRQRGYC